MRQTSSMGNMMCLGEGSIIAGAGGSALGASGVSAVDELLTLESRSAMVGHGEVNGANSISGSAPGSFAG